MTEPPAPAGTIAYRAGGSIYLNLTNRCSSSCEFCIREWSDGVYGEDLRLDHEPELDEVTQAIEVAFMDGPADEVVFCGFGEPTMRLDVVLAVTEWLRLRRIRSRLDTNGHGDLLNPDVDVPAALAAAGLDAVTVSLNAADAGRVRPRLPARVRQVLQGRLAFRRTVSCAWNRDHADRRRLPGRRPAGRRRPRGRDGRGLPRSRATRRRAARAAAEKGDH